MMMASHELHAKQRYALKCLHYFADGGQADGRRDTDPAQYGWRDLGMTEEEAVDWKEDFRAMILEGAKNIDAGARP